MFGLGEAIEKKETQLHQIESSAKQLRGEIDILKKAREILEQRGAAAVPAHALISPEQRPRCVDIHRNFP
jgi:hypothetical protein